MKYDEALQLLGAVVASDEYGTHLRIEMRDDFFVMLSNGHGEPPATLDDYCLTFDVEDDVCGEPTEWLTLREALLDIYGVCEGEAVPECLRVDDATV